MDTLHDILHSIINHLVPHEGNDYRPHLLQKAAMIGLFAMVVLTFTLANFQALLWQSSHFLVGAVLPAVVVDLTNEQRTENHLATLKRNTVLDEAATLKAQDMAINSYFSHNSPAGITPWHWFDAAGYKYVYAGENLAVYFTDSNAVVDAWMKSPTHRANIVGNQYEEIGVGTAKGTYNGYDTVFVVQLFGTRAARTQPTTPEAVVTAAPSRVVATTTQSVRIVPQPPRAVLGAETSAPTSSHASEVRKENQKSVETAPTTTLLATTELTASSSHNTVTPLPVVAAAPSYQTVAPDKDMARSTFATADFVAIQSDMATSKTNLVPATLKTDDVQIQPPVPTVYRLATEPNRVLQYIYVCIGVLTLLALFASVLIEWRKHRPRQTVYGVMLLLLICGLFYLHVTLTASVLIV